MASETSRTLETDNISLLRLLPAKLLSSSTLVPGEVNSTSSSPVLKLPGGGHVVVRMRCWLLLSVTMFLDLL